MIREGYKCQYMNRDEPDPEVIRMTIDRYPHCVYQQHFVMDNVHHDQFLIYY